MRSLIVIGPLALACLSGCITAQTEQATAVTAPSAELQKLVAEAQATSFAAATLAVFDSFEWRAAPSYNALANIRHDAARKVIKKLITVERGDALLRDTDNARALLDKAKEACKQDDRTGKCSGSEAVADAYLTQANVMIARLR